MQISFFNSVSQKVIVSVYSADGQLIETISNYNLEKGQQNFTFGENISPGIYFVHIKTIKQSKIEKLLIR